MSIAEADAKLSSSPGVETRYAIDSVVHALRLLGAFTQRSWIGLNEAESVVGASRSTAYRLLVTFEALNLIEKLPGGGYRAGQGLVQWAACLMSQLDVRTIAAPVLNLLWEETGETVNLAVLRATGLVYTDIIVSQSPLRMADTPGSDIPLHATALGKAVAAYLEPQRLSRLLGQEPYPAFTSRTRTTEAALNRDLDEVRSRGYAIDSEEQVVGVVCVGAPILVAGIPVAAISVSGPAVRFVSDRLSMIGYRLVSVATELAHRMPTDRRI